MSDKKDSANPTQPQASQPSPDQSEIDERLEQEADEMAEAASKTEQRYDQEHGLFTK
ncbi:MAG TPA: hypothetical protein VMU28_13275 [Terriglobales bacterium]|nr:hypothetical protein [Terriglobales bacterium]